jgi:Zn-dependent protease with chaperone function
MTATLTGRYFFPRSSRFVEATASIGADRTLHIANRGGGAIEEAHLRSVRVSLRIGHVMRRFGLPSGARFDVADNDAVDEFLRGAGMRVRGAAVDRLENSWRATFLALALAAAAVFAFVFYGIPQTARLLAEATPPTVDAIISEQAMNILDGPILQSSRLSPDAIVRANRLFARVAATGRRGRDGYRLVIRAGGPAVGPNAFALPDGTIIMTDEMWRLIRREDEIEGVFAHEISHVDRRHNLQVLYQAALVPAAIVVITGDLSQITQLATLLPGILIQAAYTRALEQEADDDAAVTLRRLGGDPAALGGVLERLEKEHCKPGQCPPSWIGSHPDTRERIQRLRNHPGPRVSSRPIPPEPAPVDGPPVGAQMKETPPPKAQEPNKQ